MSEKEPKDPRIDELLASFGPKEKAEAILFLLFEYKDEMGKLSQKDQDILEQKMNLLTDEIKKEDGGDEELILGLTSEIKGWLARFNCPPDRLETENLIQFRNARLATGRQEYGIGETEADQDPFAAPKKKEYKN